MRYALSILLGVLLLAVPHEARAQQVNIGGFDRLTVYKQEKLGDKHYLFTGAVELERGDTTIYADSVEYFEDEDRAIAKATSW
ncbi:MAG: LptA/OstA family protein [Vicinamibacterales bacterium]